MAAVFELQQEERARSRDIVDSHIRLLRGYNDIKDVGQQLLGLIADNRGVSITSLYGADEFGVGAHD